MTNVEYYYACACHGITFVVDKTNMHHDAFYNNPLSELIFTLCGHMAPNKHCEFILGLGSHCYRGSTCGIGYVALNVRQHMLGMNLKV